jgi:hypothetical protein
LRYRYGYLNGNLVGINSAPGVPWETTGELNAPDLRGHEVRIQFAPVKLESDDEPRWRTVWWGQVEHQEDNEWPGASYPAGERTYRCADGLLRAKRWPINSHLAYVDGQVYGNVYGNPGYNVGKDGITIGNRESSGVNDEGYPDDTDGKVFAHTHQGNNDSTTWTDLQACEHALRVGRRYGDPLFSFDGVTELLDGTGSWPVTDQDNAWDFVAKVCDRKRGRGVVFCDWTDDEPDPTGPLFPKLSIYPQTFDDITFAKTYTYSSDAYTYTTVRGATSASTVITVDLIGHHGLVDSDFKITEPQVHTADSVESYGERIQVAMTVSYGDTESLEIGWDATKEATFDGLDDSERSGDAWQLLYNAHRLKAAWLGKCGDGTERSSAVVFCDYRLAGGFSNELKTSTTGDPRTSPVLCRLLPDLPFLFGYQYSSAVAKFSSDGIDSQERIPILPLIRVDTDRYYQTDDSASLSQTYTTKVKDRTILHTSGVDQGARLIGKSALGSEYSYSQLAFTVAVELPHRLRFTTLADGKTEATTSRRVVIEHPNMHLWLAHPQCIYSLNGADEATGYAPLRVGSSFGAPYKIRDDRFSLSQMHAMACAWYLEQRRTCTWTLRDCGLLSTFAVIDDPETGSESDVAFPQLGQMVNQMIAGGQTHVLKTPITLVAYDHQAGTTTWQTDWQDLELA